MVAMSIRRRLQVTFLVIVAILIVIVAGGIYALHHTTAQFETAISAIEKAHTGAQQLRKTQDTLLNHLSQALRAANAAELEQQVAQATREAAGSGNPDIVGIAQYFSEHILPSLRLYHQKRAANIAKQQQLTRSIYAIIDQCRAASQESFLDILVFLGENNERIQSLLIATNNKISASLQTQAQAVTEGIERVKLLGSVNDALARTQHFLARIQGLSDRERERQYAVNDALSTLRQAKDTLSGLPHAWRSSINASLTAVIDHIRQASLQNQGWMACLQRIAEVRLEIVNIQEQALIDVLITQEEAEQHTVDQSRQQYTMISEAFAALWERAERQFEYLQSINDLSDKGHVLIFAVNATIEAKSPEQLRAIDDRIEDVRRAISAPTVQQHAIAQRIGQTLPSVRQLLQDQEEFLKIANYIAAMAGTAADAPSLPTLHGRMQALRLRTEESLAAHMAKARTLREDSAAFAISIQTVSVVILAVLTVIAFLCGWWITRHISTSIDNVVRTLAALTRGDFQARVEEVQDREIQHIAKVLNQLATTLEQQHRGIETAIAELNMHAQVLDELSQEVQGLANNTHSAARVAHQAAEILTKTIQVLLTNVQEIATAAEGIFHNMTTVTNLTDEAQTSSMQDVEAVHALGDAVNRVITTLGNIERLTARINAAMTAAGGTKPTGGTDLSALTQEARDLAQQAAKFAKDIAAQLDSTQQQLTVCLRHSENISQFIAHIRDMQVSVSGAFEEQHATINEMAHSLRHATGQGETIQRQMSNLVTIAKSSATSATSLRESIEAILRVSRTLQQLMMRQRG